MTGVTSPRRRERPRRVAVAVSLLLTASAAAVAGLAVGTGPALAAAATVAVVLAWTAAGLLHAQLLDERRHHTEERVDQARAFRALFVERSEDHALFATRMRDRLTAAERLGGELRGILRLAEARGDEAEDRARRESARARAAEGRVVELEAELAGRRPELVDELAAWDVVPGLDGDTVVDLLAWEERTTAPKVVEQRRRHA